MFRKSFAIVWAVLTIALLATTPARADEPMSLDQFRGRFIAAVEKVDPRVKIEVIAPDELRLTWSKDGQRTVYLANTYYYYRQNPAEADTLINRLVRLMAQSTHEVDESADRLVLLVRQDSFGDSYEAAAAQSGKPKNHLFSEPVADGLALFVAYDEPEAYQYPALDKLQAKFGPDKAWIWSRARQNTLRAIGKVSVESVQPGVFTVKAADSNISASLLVDDDFWASDEIKAAGAHPVVLVGKELLVVVDGADVKALAWLQGFADSRDPEDRDWLSTQLYVRQGGRWAVLPRQPEPSAAK
jgi:hypothetical protein